VEVRHGGGEEVKIARGAGDVHSARQTQRLAGVHALRMRQALPILLDALSQSQQKARTLSHRRACPAREGARRRLHGQFDIAFVAVRHTRADGAGGRIDLVEGLARDGVNVFAVDEIADGEHDTRSSPLHCSERRC
jgi:hypothetical protein